MPKVKKSDIVQCPICTENGNLELVEISTATFPEGQTIVCHECGMRAPAADVHDCETIAFSMWNEMALAFGSYRDLLKVLVLSEATILMLADYFFDKTDTGKYYHRGRTDLNDLAHTTDKELDKIFDIIAKAKGE